MNPSDEELCILHHHGGCTHPFAISSSIHVLCMFNLQPSQSIYKCTFFHFVILQFSSICTCLTAPLRFPRDEYLSRAALPSWRSQLLFILLACFTIDGSYVWRLQSLCCCYPGASTLTHACTCTMTHPHCPFVATNKKYMPSGLLYLTYKHYDLNFCRGHLASLDIPQFISPMFQHPVVGAGCIQHQIPCSMASHEAQLHYSTGTLRSFVCQLSRLL